MTRAKDISKIITDADFSGTLDVAGTVTAGGLTVDAAIPTLQLNDTDGTNQFGKMRQAGANLLVTSRDNTSNGGFRVAGDNGTSETNRFNIASNGDISFYEDTGTTPKLFWDASAERLGIGTTSPDQTLHVFKANAGAVSSASSAVITIENSSDASLQFLTPNTALNQIRFGDVQDNGSGIIEYNHNNAYMSFETNGSERMRINSSGNVIFSSNEPTLFLKDSNNANTTRYIKNSAEIFTIGRINDDLSSSSVEHLRVDDGGNFMVGTTSNSPSGVSDKGVSLNNSGLSWFVRQSGTVVVVARNTNDGALLSLRQGGTEEGSISVSGSTVSYNGGHLSRWSRLLDNSKDTTIVKGTVMTNLDEMVEWGDEDNEQLNKMAVSSVEGDANVAGVFVNWDNDDDWNDMNIAMTGDMVIRIAQGTTVARGDLLMSAGDGTAKPQGDDIVRSKTIAKVTSTNVSHTYDDGTYLVPCVLMAC